MATLTSLHHFFNVNFNINKYSVDDVIPYCLKSMTIKVIEIFLPIYVSSKT